MADKSFLRSFLQQLHEAEERNTASSNVSAGTRLAQAVRDNFVANSTIEEVDVTSQEAYFTIVYEFPEHRQGVTAAVRKAMKGAADVKGRNVSRYGEYGIVFEIEFNEPISNPEGLADALRNDYRSA